MMNQRMLRIKAIYMGRLREQILNQMQQEQQNLQYQADFQPTKQQRKAIGLLYKNSKKVQLRAYFTKLTVQTNQFRRVNNPYLKEMGAAMCIFANYVKMKKRKAFQKLRANTSQVYYRDFAGAEQRDRDKLLSLAKTLFETNLNVQDASHNLEDAIMRVMEQAMVYLQE